MLANVLTNGQAISFDPLIQTILTLDRMDSTGRLKLLPAAEWQRLPHNEIQAWCQLTGRYGIPTLELVDWLRGEIGDRKAIEIGAGNGDLGYHVGIKQTDSYIQVRSPEITERYANAGIRPTLPHADVVEIDGEQAVQKFKPDVVIASWVTRKFVKGYDEIGKAQAFIYGVNEEKILKGCKKYIFIGNEKVHNQKTLLSQPHETYHFPWLVSRAEDQSLNVIYVWENQYWKQKGL